MLRDATQVSELSASGSNAEFCLGLGGQGVVRKVEDKQYASGCSWACKACQNPYARNPVSCKQDYFMACMCFFIFFMLPENLGYLPGLCG